MVVMCIVAHPDDECLMGAAIARFVSEGHRVHVLVLADGETSRAIGIADAAALAARVTSRCFKQLLAAKVLGCQVLPGPSYLDQRLDMVPLLDLTQIIERAIAQVTPTVVYTHSPGDLNADHRRVYEAVLPAVRPKSGVTSVYCFEGPAMRRPFQPTTFWTITEAQLEQQHQALLCYGDELIADWPLMRARAVVYGYRVGAPLAQGFEVVREGG